MLPGGGGRDYWRVGERKWTGVRKACGRGWGWGVQPLLRGALTMSGSEHTIRGSGLCSSSWFAGRDSWLASLAWFAGRLILVEKGSTH